MIAEPWSDVDAGMKKMSPTPKVNLKNSSNLIHFCKLEGYANEVVLYS